MLRRGAAAARGSALFYCRQGWDRQSGACMLRSSRAITRMETLTCHFRRGRTNARFFGEAHTHHITLLHRESVCEGRWLHVQGFTDSLASCAGPPLCSCASSHEAFMHSLNARISSCPCQVARQPRSCRRECLLQPVRQVPGVGAPGL